MRVTAPFLIRCATYLLSIVVIASVIVAHPYSPMPTSTQAVDPIDDTVDTITVASNEEHRTSGSGDGTAIIASSVNRRSTTATAAAAGAANPTVGGPAGWTVPTTTATTSFLRKKPGNKDKRGFSQSSLSPCLHVNQAALVDNDNDANIDNQINNISSSQHSSPTTLTQQFAASASLSTSIGILSIDDNEAGDDIGGKRNKQQQERPASPINLRNKRSKPEPS